MQYHYQKLNTNQVPYSNQQNSRLNNAQRTSPSSLNQQQKPVNNQSEEIQSLETDLFIAQLGALGGIIQSIGGVISTAASLLALQDIQKDINRFQSPNTQALGGGTLLPVVDTTKSSVTSNSNINDSNARINELEQQVQYLMRELNSLKHSKKEE